MTLALVRKILSDHNIPIAEDNANVSSACIGICCPFCGDTNFHGGIFKDRFNFTCWKCNARVSFFTLIQRMTGMSWTEFKRLEEAGDTPVVAGDVEQAIRDILQHELDSGYKTIGTSLKALPLPVFCTPIAMLNAPNDSPLLTAFLDIRHIAYSTCIAHNAAVGHFVAGPYANKLVCPIEDEHGVAFAYQGRDMTQVARSRFYTTPGAKINQTLYNYKEAKRHKTVILVEGIFDAWRLGKQAVASFGHSLTDRQRQLLIQINSNHLVIAWDPDAYAEAEKEAGELRPYINKVSVLIMPSWEDPDSLGRERFMQLLEGGECT